ESCSLECDLRTSSPTVCKKPRLVDTRYTSKEISSLSADICGSDKSQNGKICDTSTSIYSNDADIPVLEREKKQRYTVPEAVKILLDDQPKMSSKVPLRVRRNISFGIDTSELNCWQDVKSDMNGVYYNTLRIATWTIDVNENNNVKKIEKKKVSLLCERQFHVYIHSTKNAAGLCRSVFLLRGCDEKCHDAVKSAGGIVRACEPGELPRSKRQVYDLNRNMKKTDQVDELLQYSKHREEAIVIEHHDVPEDLWRTGLAPTFVGPTAIHHSKQKSVYKKIVSAVVNTSPNLPKNAKGFITDGEQALHDSLKEDLKHATGLRCFRHFYQNCKDKLYSLKIQTKKEQKFFLDKVFGDSGSGILDAVDKSDLKHRLSAMEEPLKKEEKLTGGNSKKNDKNKVNLTKLQFTRDVWEEVDKHQQEELEMAICGLSREFELSDMEAKKLLNCKNSIQKMPSLEPNQRVKYMVAAKTYDQPKSVECRQCRMEFPRRQKIVPYDIVLPHEEKWMYPDPTKPNCKLPSAKYTVKFYCVKCSCIKERFPYYNSSLIQIPIDVKGRLCESHQNLLAEELFVG
ncbi:Hypothetical predicted protein, partial [Paramuricea clavata]